MELNLVQSILLGFLSGIAEILPVSAEAHRLIALKLFGSGSTMPAILELFLHIGTLAGLYYCCYHHILRMTRAWKLARIPKRRRKRPLDTRSLMDLSLLKTTLIPIVAGFFFHEKIASISNNLVLVAFFLLLNGVILYIPQFLPGSNKDSRSMSRVDGLLIGLGGAFSTIPGISCIGAGVSISSVLGVDKQYGLNLSLLMTIPVTVGLIAMDILAILGAQTGLTIGLLFSCILCAAAAFAGVVLAIRLLRSIVANVSMSVFGLYCWSAALFAFLLYLTAA